jgi:hypothetical protein
MANIPAFIRMAYSGFLNRIKSQEKSVVNWPEPSLYKYSITRLLCIMARAIHTMRDRTNHSISAPNAKPTLRLCEVPRRGTYRVCSVYVNRHRAMDLEEHGIFAGNRMEVVHNDFRGTLAVQVGGRIVILGREVSFHLVVRQL